MYPEIMVIPMREELSRAGVSEARTAADVDQAVAQPGTTMLVVNSICGCAAGKMRPGVRMAMQHTGSKPDHAVTVFAGQDREATEKARGYFGGHPPTSPAICDSAGWAARLPDAAVGDRDLDGSGDCAGTGAGFRYLLCEGFGLDRTTKLNDKAERNGATGRNVRNVRRQRGGRFGGSPVLRAGLWGWGLLPI